MSQKLKIKELIPHKDNNYFFDDIEGEAWQEFINSVKTSGVIEPIVVTQDKVIVSGHQRVRACKALGIEEIEAEVRIFDSEDEILKCLIDTNIRQRGIGNPNPVKFSRCIKEIERIEGIRQGSGGTGANQYTKEQKVQYEPSAQTQEQLAESYGISLSQWKRYKEIGNYIPEIQDLIETQIVTPSVARAIIKQLPEFQQKELAEQLSGEDRKTKKQVQELIDRIKELENRKPEVKTVVKEVVPDDYREVKSKAKAYDAETKRLNQKLTDAYNEQNQLREKISELEDKTSGHELHARVVEGSLLFVTACGTFVRDYGGYIWITDHLDELSPNELKDYEYAIRNVYAWASKFLDALDLGKEKMLNE